MRTKLIRVGNSRGIRIPKAIIEQLALDEDVEMEMAIEHGRLVIQSASRCRQGWDEAFAAMAAAGDDALLDASVPTEWDRKEWEW
ncbi:MAG: AbrB/MazE/SpoVT family DNA-binding domain-containing protein [Candidatus Hydrogenedens sp.]|nr:AbrB/MazE/SpoVT family DNA-binding domain-containing protein [Candidatus Hydrogenedens sp.]